jgi:hypothetical protein
LPRVWGLTGANNAGTPLTQYDYAATGALVRDPAGGGTLVLTPIATRTLDIGAAGPVAGGRDQAGTFNANTWIHGYLIAKTDGTYHVTASLTAPPTGPTLPSGYTLWAYLGALRVNNASQLIATYTQGAAARYQAAQIILTDGRATVETLIACSTLVPPTATGFTVHMSSFNRRGTNTYPTIRLVSGGGDYDLMGMTGDVSSTFRTELTVPNVNQSLYYLFPAAPAAGFGLHLYVRGYENPV